MANKIIIHTDIVKGTINPNIYGHFAEHLGRCIYEGVWVGKDSSIPNTNGIRNDVVEALRKIKVPVLRWPGGCFADEYHWKDGVGPVDQRKKMINTHWGGVIEYNHFGTHEFLMFCEMIGAEPYISGNVGSGTVQEMSEWVEYITFDGDSEMANWRRENGKEEPWKLKYFGVGNENWGCGGRMRPEYYADLYRRYQTYVRNYGDNQIFKIACGPNAANYHWMEVLMREANEYMDGISLHHYTVPGDNWDAKGSALDFTEQEWVITMKKALIMDELITKHSAIMDQYDPDKRVALIVDEWGTWFDVEPGTHPRFLHQQNSIRDALVAGLTLHIFHDHCDRVQMANIAQLVNVLQSVILTEGEKMILTPTYHVFEMFKNHQGAELIDTHCEISTYEEDLPQISVSASRSKDGKINISLCNLDHQTHADVQLDLRGLIHSDIKVTGRELSSTEMNAHNTFDEPNQVEPKPFTNFKQEGTTIKATLSPMSVNVLEVTV